MMERQEERVVRVVELMGFALDTATRRFAQGCASDEVLAATNDAISLVVDLPIDVFLGMTPQTMVALLEMSGADDRLTAKVAEAMLLQADILQSEGSLIEAAARREQAAAVLDFIDPNHAN